MQLYIKTRYKGFKEIKYETIKLVDAINFLESDKFKKWLEINKDKQAKINPSLTNMQTYEIFDNATVTKYKDGGEFMGSLPFKNFKKIWGRQIKFIDAC